MHVKEEGEGRCRNIVIKFLSRDFLFLFSRLSFHPVSSLSLFYTSDFSPSDYILTQAARLTTNPIIVNVRLRERVR